MITLRYAEAIGKGRIPEIVNWKDLESTLDGHVPATAEAFGSSSYSHLNYVGAESPILTEKKSLKFLPLHFEAGMVPDTVPYFPFVKDKKLLVMKEDEKGNIVLFDKGYFAGKHFSVHMTFEESDIVNLLTGVYKLYSRNRGELPRLMDLFMKHPHN